MDTLSSTQVAALAELLQSFSMSGDLKSCVSRLVDRIPEGVEPVPDAPKHSSVDLARLREDIDSFLQKNPPQPLLSVGARPVPRGPLGSVKSSVWPGNPEKVAINKRYFDEHREELANKYRNEFIAVKDGAVTAHGAYDHVFVNGEQHAYMVFPSNPEYKHPPAMVGLVATIHLGDTDIIKVPTSIQLGKSEPEEQGELPNFKCIDVDAIVDTGATFTTVSKAWAGDDLWNIGRAVILDDGREVREVCGIVAFGEGAGWKTPIWILDTPSFILGRALLQHCQMIFIGSKARQPLISRSVAKGDVVFVLNE